MPPKHKNGNMFTVKLLLTICFKKYFLGFLAVFLRGGMFEGSLVYGGTFQSLL